MRLLLTSDVQFSSDLEVEVVFDVLSRDNMSKVIVIVNQSGILTLFFIIDYCCKVQHVIANLSFCLIVTSWGDVSIGFKTSASSDILLESEDGTHYS